MIVHFNRRNKCVTSALWSSNNLAVNSNTDTAVPGPYGCQLEYHSSLVSEQTVTKEYTRSHGGIALVNSSVLASTVKGYFFILFRGC